MAFIRVSGVPQRPKPDDSTSDPDLISLTASLALLYTLLTPGASEIEEVDARRMESGVYIDVYFGELCRRDRRRAVRDTTPSMFA